MDGGGRGLWLPITGCCQACTTFPGGQLIPGSLWDYQAPQANLSLPLELLCREVLLTIKQMELEDGKRS